MIERLHDAGTQVRIEHAVAAARRRLVDRGGSPSTRPSNVAATAASSPRSSGRPAGASSRSDAPALGRAAGEAREDELLERGAERDAGQLAPGGEHLLGDERVAARSLRDEQQRGGGRALALDLGDELGEVEPVERPELESRRRIRATR